MSDSIDESASRSAGEGAPEPESAATEATEPTEDGASSSEQTEAKPAPRAGDDGDPAAKRISRLTARYAQTARERDELAARIAQLEQRQSQGDTTPDQQAAIRAEAERLVAERESKRLIEDFHERGRDAFPDWRDRCEALMAMGADADMSKLLIEMKDGHRVAAALHDDPDELERIARLRTPTARAIALGQFAERMAAGSDGGTNARRGALARTATRAPAPIRPVQGRASPAFNEYTADADALADFYMRKAKESRQQSTR